MNKNSNSIYYKTSLINLLITVTLFAIAIPFFFFKLMDIPLGILLGGVFSSLIYLIFGKFEGRKMSYTIVLVIVKSLIYILIFVGLCFLFFKANVKIFNPIAFMVMYMIPTILLLIFSRKETTNAWGTRFNW